MCVCLSTGRCILVYLSCALAECGVHERHAGCSNMNLALCVASWARSVIVNLVSLRTHDSLISPPRLSASLSDALMQAFPSFDCYKLAYHVTRSHGYVLITTFPLDWSRDQIRIAFVTGCWNYQRHNKLHADCDRSRGKQLRIYSCEGTSAWLR